MPREQRLQQPIKVTTQYAAEDSAADKTHHVVAWLLGDNTDIEGMLKAHLLSNVLLNDSASPLRQFLETTDLGSAPSPVCGMEEGTRDMVFVCGLEGCQADTAEQVLAGVLEVIERVADAGVPQSQVEAVLHQLELSQREVRGDSYPYGLQLILSGLSTAIHRGDVMSVLDVDPAIERLREAIQDPDFIKGLARDLLVNNPHRVLLSMTPNSELDARKQAAEAARLARHKAELSDTDKTEIVELAATLEARQNQTDDETILPKVGLEDVPDHITIPRGELSAAGELPLTRFAQGTNGLVYQQCVIELPALDEAQLALLPLYTTCLTELGAGDNDYLAMQSWQSAVSGGVSAFSSVRGAIQDVQQVTGYLVLSGKALVRNQEALTELMQTTLEQIRFDEHARIQDLVALKRAQAEQSVTGNGHALAMGAAASGMSPVAAMNFKLGGLAGIKTLKQLDDGLKTDTDKITTVAEQLASIHQLVLAAPRQFLLVAEEDKLADFQQVLTTQWGAGTDNGKGFSAFQLPTTTSQVKQVWTTTSQVNFCAKAYPTVPVEHEDAAALTVLGEFMRNGFLHRTIREQGGAYGGGASHDAANAISVFILTVTHGCRRRWTISTAPSIGC